MVYGNGTTAEVHDIGGGRQYSWSRRREGGVIIRIWMGYIDHIVYVGLVIYLPSD